MQLQVHVSENLYPDTINSSEIFSLFYFFFLIWSDRGCNPSESHLRLSQELRFFNLLSDRQDGSFKNPGKVIKTKAAELI